MHAYRPDARDCCAKSIPKIAVSAPSHHLRQGRSWRDCWLMTSQVPGAGRLIVNISDPAPRTAFEFAVPLEIQGTTARLALSLANLAVARSERYLLVDQVRACLHHGVPELRFYRDSEPVFRARMVMSRFVALSREIAGLDLAASETFQPEVADWPELTSVNFRDAADIDGCFVVLSESRASLFCFMIDPIFNLLPDGTHSVPVQATARIETTVRALKALKASMDDVLRGK